jgi:hypothetical protein|tara:strand:- start:182 stop:376 length:195 start_codon:yes stop_codon:yes gene_type:complete
MKPKKHEEKLIKLYLTEKQVKNIIADVDMTYSIHGGFSSDTQKIVANILMVELKKQKEKKNEQV